MIVRFYLKVWYKNYLFIIILLSVFICSRGKRGGGHGGAKKKKKGKKYEDRPQHMGGEVVTREYAGGSHPPDARYADMAPK